MNEFSVTTVPVLGDNYAYIIQSLESVVIIDPSESEPILNVLNEIWREPSHILVTHYDSDHIGGVGEIRSKFGARVIGPHPATIGIDETCSEKTPLVIGDLTFQVIDTPGHQDPHVSFYEASRGWLFSGDCLFSAGCGRVRRDAYSDMYTSLQKLAALPDETSVFFGHEYTESNLAFAFAFEPDNKAIEEYGALVAQMKVAGKGSSPSTIGREKAVNPFLRTSSAQIRKELNLPDASDEEVFTALRKAKNQF